MRRQAAEPGPWQEFAHQRIAQGHAVDAWRLASTQRKPPCLTNKPAAARLAWARQLPSACCADADCCNRRFIHVEPEPCLANGSATKKWTMWPDACESAYPAMFAAIVATQGQKGKSAKGRKVHNISRGAFSARCYLPHAAPMNGVDLGLTLRTEAWHQPEMNTCREARHAPWNACPDTHGWPDACQAVLIGQASW